MWQKMTNNFEFVLPFHFWENIEGIESLGFIRLSMLIENPFSLIIVVWCDVKFRLSLNVLVFIWVGTIWDWVGGKSPLFFSTMALGTLWWAKFQWLELWVECSKLKSSGWPSNFWLALMSILHVHWANKEESLITLTKCCWLILRAPPLHINKESSINTYCRKVCHLKTKNAISNKFVPHYNHGIEEAPILLLHATTLVNKD